MHKGTENSLIPPLLPLLKVVLMQMTNHGQYSLKTMPKSKQYGVVQRTESGGKKAGTSVQSCDCLRQQARQ